MIKKGFYLQLYKEAYILSNTTNYSLKEKTDDLEVLLEEINKAYEPSEDEFINEMFYSSLYKAKEFCSTLDYLLRKM